jgi:hypothetical protein
MAKNQIKLNVKPLGMRIDLWGLVVLSLVSALASFGVLDLTAQNTNILVAISIAFVLAEASIMQVVKGAKAGKLPDVVSLVSIIVALLAAVGLMASLLGFSIGALATYQGVTLSVLSLMVIVEALRK